MTNLPLVVICFQICIFVLGDTPSAVATCAISVVVICFQICIFVLGDTPGYLGLSFRP